jgi:hypothetical protein
MEPRAAEIQRADAYCDRQDEKSDPDDGIAFPQDLFPFRLSGHGALLSLWKWGPVALEVWGRDSTETGRRGDTARCRGDPVPHAAV